MKGILVTCGDAANLLSHVITIHLTSIMDRDYRDRSLGDFLLVLLTGITLGAIASIFYKKNENEINSKVRQFSNEVKNRSGNTYDSLRESVRSASGRLRGTVDDTISGSRDEMAEIRNDASDIVENADDMVDEGTSRIKRGLRKL
jgi:t-SNARE complex subunit (syntaxin)